MATRVEESFKASGGAVRASTETRSRYIRIGTAPGQIDLELLESALRETLRGEVRFDPGGRALYATDSSTHRQVPPEACSTRKPA